MDDKNSSSEALWSRLLRGEENQDQVDQLLAQFHEENALQLNLHSHTLKSPLILPSKDLDGFDSAGLDHLLAMRYAKLKSASSKPQSKETIHFNKHISGNGKDSNNSKGEIGGIGERGRVLVDQEEELILGQNLAARLAALKTTTTTTSTTSSSSSASPEVSGVRGFASQGTQLGFQGEETCSEEERVQRLLASVQDSLRLEKSGVRGLDEEDEVSDSEVDKIVEWAKDAARLEQHHDDDDDDEEEEEEVVGAGREGDEDEGRGKRRNERK